MLLKINIKIISTISFILLMGACSIAGSWAYGKLDGYLNNYFFTFANFTQAQEKEIKTVTRDFKYWLTKEQLPEIELILNKVNTLNRLSSSDEIDSIYRNGSDIFISVNTYFNSKLIKFSLTLDKKQIGEIDNHFLEIQEKREEEKKDRDDETYEERLQKNYISGFKRIGIDLNSQQRIILASSIKDMEDNSEEWNLLQAKWTEEMISILKTNQQNGFEKKLNNHLSSLFDLGPPSFRDKIERNRIIGIAAIKNIISSMNDSQFKKMKKSIRVYQRSINRILENQNQEGPS
tara:strand:- start:291 stop:1163 length:873 start_codon:yes stop_codon:yes gene_type:complete